MEDYTPQQLEVRTGQRCKRKVSSQCAGRNSHCLLEGFTLELVQGNSGISEAESDIAQTSPGPAVITFTPPPTGLSSSGTQLHRSAATVQPLSTSLAGDPCRQIMRSVEEHYTAK